MASIQREGRTPETASSLATLGPKFKVQIPLDCIGIIAWPLESPVRLIAELVEAGCIRLHLASEVLPQIEAKRAEIQQGNALNRLQLLGAIDDKYRQVNLYTKGSENSVILEERMVVYLGVLPNDNRKLFVEGTKNTVDIMSLTYRNRRIEDLKDETSI